MCKKIRELNGKTPAELLTISNQTGAFPIDVAEICYKMGIHLVPFDFSVLKNGNGSFSNDSSASREETDASWCRTDGEQKEILGAIIVKGDDLAILYKSDDLVNDRRFTIAHEIAHSCLHMKPDNQFHIEFLTDSQDEQEKEKEQQADRFARRLLIPADSLWKVIGDSVRVSPKTVSTLSTLFMVSEEVMWTRLRELEISIVDPLVKRYTMVYDS